MDLEWTREAIEQLDWHWANHFRPALDGLTDDEYRWEPVPGCWSIRRRDEARAGAAAGAGDYVLDRDVPPPDPAPFTTLAWRLGHITEVLAERASRHFGDASVTAATIDWSGDAAGALALLDGAYDQWLAGIRTLGDTGMARPIGPLEGPFAEYPFGALVLHVNREVIHHGAEVMLLRDLYANTPRRA